MAHSNLCCCRGCHEAQVYEIGLAALLADQRLKGHELKSLQFPVRASVCGNPRECIQTRSICIFTSCNAGFCFKCFKLNLCSRSLYLSLLCDKDILRGRLRGKDLGQWRTGPTSIMSRVHSKRRRDGMGTFHASTSCQTLKTQHHALSPSFPSSVWLSDSITQWGLKPWAAGVPLHLMNPSRPPPTGVTSREACSDSIGIAYLP